MVSERSQDRSGPILIGSTPAPLNILPVPRVFTMGFPAGTLTDMAPLVNIPSFGTCQSILNPTVAAATAVALGVLTPMPCVPVPAGSWLNPSPTVLIGGKPALTSQSTLMCAWGGQISIRFPGQITVQL